VILSGLLFDEPISMSRWLIVYNVGQGDYLATSSDEDKATPFPVVNRKKRKKIDSSSRVASREIEEEKGDANDLLSKFFALDFADCIYFIPLSFSRSSIWR